MCTIALRNTKPSTLVNVNTTVNSRYKHIQYKPIFVVSIGPWSLHGKLLIKALRYKLRFNRSIVGLVPTVCEKWELSVILRVPMPRSSQRHHHRHHHLPRHLPSSPASCIFPPMFQLPLHLPPQSLAPSLTPFPPCQLSNDAPGWGVRGGGWARARGGGRAASLISFLFYLGLASARSPLSFSSQPRLKLPLFFLSPWLDFLLLDPAFFSCSIPLSWASLCHCWWFGDRGLGRCSVVDGRWSGWVDRFCRVWWGGLVNYRIVHSEWVELLTST